MAECRPSDRSIYTVATGQDVRYELLAMRQWLLLAEKETGRPVLTSLNGQQVWLGPVLEWPWAPGEPAGPNAGVNGLKRSYRHWFWLADWFYGPDTMVWGWVALSGLVEETRGGYRAERGVIRQLRLGPFVLAEFASRAAAARLVAELEDRYRCPVKIGYPEWRVSRMPLAQRER
jgi:hypothetical protein